jgi:hypothetical protein
MVKKSNTMVDRPMNRIIFQPDGTRIYPIFSPRRRLYKALYEPEAIISLFSPRPRRYEPETITPIARPRGSRQVVSEAN